MNPKEERFRFFLTGAVVALILFAFVYQLVFIQITQGEAYKRKVTQGYTRTQTVTAARGEIVDRYGRPFATNRISLDIILDQAYLPAGQENQVIYELIQLLESLGQGWTDNLPVSEPVLGADGQYHYSFLPDRESQVARLKSDLHVEAYATADDCMWRLCAPSYYDLGHSADEEEEKRHPRPWADDPAAQRKLAGVRYEMAQQDFSYKNNYIFATDVSNTVATNVQERRYALPGVDVVQSTVREFSNGTLAPHIIGITGPLYREDMEALKEQGLWWSEDNQQGYRASDVIGRSGIESAYESVLRGSNGERRITINAQHQVVDVTETVPPTPGGTVVLTLDQDLQKVAQDALADQIALLQKNTTINEGKDASAGAAVCVAVKTGEVLAAATFPSYDNSSYYQDYARLSQQKPEPYLNRATMGLYRPGSTYKPCVATAGLAEGVVGETETVLCTGVYTRLDPFLPRCLYVNGNIDVRHALQVSCNVFFYETGWRLGIDLQNEYAAHFGLGDYTGIEIGEAKGQRSSRETREAVGDTWNNGDIIQSAIGQLDHGFTPIQLASYTATLASDGQRMQLHLVKSVNGYGSGAVEVKTEPKVVDQVPASPEVFQVVREGMIAASQPGGTSAQSWIDFPMTVASKTGTPESLDNLTSTYICYMPAEDPEIAIAVDIEDGGQGYTGAPVARKIADQYFFGGIRTETVTPPGVLLP